MASAISQSKAKRFRFSQLPHPRLTEATPLIPRVPPKTAEKRSGMVFCEAARYDWLVTETKHFLDTQAVPPSSDGTAF